MKQTWHKRCVGDRAGLMPVNALRDIYDDDDCVGIGAILVLVDQSGMIPARVG